MSLVAALLGGTLAATSFTPSHHPRGHQHVTRAGANIGASPSKYHWRLPGPRGWHANPLIHRCCGGGYPCLADLPALAFPAPVVFPRRAPAASTPGAPPVFIEVLFRRKDDHV
jgi:hypothetical protein